MQGIQHVESLQENYLSINLLKKTQINLNDLKDRKDNKPSIKNFFVSSNIILLILAVIISLGLIMIYWKILNENSVLEKDQAALRKQYLDLTTSQKGYLEFSIKSSILANQLNSDPIQATVYKSISNTLQNSQIDYEISSIAFENSKFNYKFITNDFLSSTNLFDSLQKSKQFINISLASASQNLTGKIETTITFDATK